MLRRRALLPPPFRSPVSLRRRGRVRHLARAAPRAGPPRITRDRPRPSESRLEEGLAPGGDGATLHVGSGTFDWSFDWEGVVVSDKHITIIGAGASNTVLDRHQGGRFFAIRETGSVTLIGVTVQNGRVGVVAMLLRSVRVM